MRKMKQWLSLLLALVMACGLTPGVLAVSLPSDVQYFEGSAYRIYTETLSWEQAKEYCENLGGHLVTITSSKEQQFIDSINGYNRRLWIGGYRNDDFEWQWVTGEAWDYANWADGEPNDSSNVMSNENRAAVWPSKWNDLNENNKGEQSGFICEWTVDNRTSFGSEVSNWASPEMEQAYKENLIPDCLIGEDLTQDISRAEFAAVSVKVFEALTGTKALPAVTNPFTDCQDVEVLKAYNVGITNGTSDTTFSPDRLLNREQAATMLTRVFKRATMPGWTLAADNQFSLSYTKPAPFRDDQDISGYARDSVYFMVANHIINGVGDNLFAPRNITDKQTAEGYANATREQALAISLRMVQNLD